MWMCPFSGRGQFGPRFLSLLISFSLTTCLPTVLFYCHEPSVSTRLRNCWTQKFNEFLLYTYIHTHTNTQEHRHPLISSVMGECLCAVYSPSSVSGYARRVCFVPFFLSVTSWDRGVYNPHPPHQKKETLLTTTFFEKRFWYMFPFSLNISQWS